MTKRIKIGNLTVEVFFNEYDKIKKTRKQIAGHELTRQDRAAIDRGLDDTDFGEFYKYEDSVKEITGMFNVVDSN
jgi:predicted transcriptional regulator